MEDPGPMAGRWGIGADPEDDDEFAWRPRVVEDDLSHLGLQTTVELDNGVTVVLDPAALETIEAALEKYPDNETCIVAICKTFSTAARSLNSRLKSFGAIVERILVDPRHQERENILSGGYLALEEIIRRAHDEGLIRHGCGFLLERLMIHQHRGALLAAVCLNIFQLLHLAKYPHELEADNRVETYLLHLAHALVTAETSVGLHGKARREIVHLLNKIALQRAGTCVRVGDLNIHEHVVRAATQLLIDFPVTELHVAFGPDRPDMLHDASDEYACMVMALDTIQVAKIASKLAPFKRSDLLLRCAQEVIKVTDILTNLANSTPTIGTGKRKLGFDALERLVISPMGQTAARCAQLEVAMRRWVMLPALYMSPDDTSVRNSGGELSAAPIQLVAAFLEFDQVMREHSFYNGLILAVLHSCEEYTYDQNCLEHMRVFKIVDQEPGARWFLWGNGVVELLLQALRVHERNYAYFPHDEPPTCGKEARRLLLMYFDGAYGDEPLPGLVPFMMRHLT